MKVNIKIRFFAKAREIVGQTESILSVEETLPYQELAEIIIGTYHLEDIKNSIILAVNEEYCEIDDIISLKTNDEIAVIPPISGG